MSLLGVTVWKRSLPNNVIILRNILEEEKRRRSVEILKFRGTGHQKGESSFTIVEDQGLGFLPLSALELSQGSATKRITSGSAGRPMIKVCVNSASTVTAWRSVASSGMSSVSCRVTPSTFLNPGYGPD